MSVLVRTEAEPWKCSIEAASLGRAFRKEESLQKVTELHSLFMSKIIRIWGCLSYSFEAGFGILRDHSGKLMEPRRTPDRKDVVSNDRAP